MTPQEISDVDLAFPGQVSRLMPDYKEIPDEFKHGNNKYCAFQAKWFFEGLEGIPKPKDGVDVKKAMRHLSAIQKSFEPRHEHKAAAVAYLASLWLEIE